MRSSRVKRRISFLVPTAAAALSVSVALAGPLPDPPFSGGGFTPADTTVLKQEQGVGKVISKYSASRTKCDQKAVSDLQKAYAAVDAAKVAAAHAKWSTCVTTADT